MNKQQFSDWHALFHAGAGDDSHPMPLVMGVMNLTPDSFYDGGRYTNLDKAYDHAQAMLAAGADIIDVGGESTRPGAAAVSVEEELDRVMPFIERMTKNSPISLSIDTSKPQVMRAAIDAGVACINDVFALQVEGALDVAAACDLPICLMHMLGKPQGMQENPQYSGDDVVAHINDFFGQRIKACMAAGIRRERLILDPGFGFGKTTQHNLHMVRRLTSLRRHQLPLLLGVSRKSSIGQILDQPVAGRLAGGLALAVYAMLEGVSIVRTHDVLETKQAFQMIQQVQAVDGGR